MTTTTKCPKCGTGVNIDERFDGICPACLYQALLAPPSLEGSELGNYHVMGILGTGGMGTVYRARQKGLERAVALKVLAGTGPDEIERFFREARAAAKLRHPNIVGIHEVSSAKGHYFFTMDLIDGRTLEGPMAPKRAAELVRTVARAVQHAHDQGVIHRDLKPANIIVDARGEPLVMDFGLAKEIRGGKTLTQTNVIMGTPAYMSPEQAGGEKHVDARADVYALGAVLYECLTGEPPFKGETALQVVGKVLDEAPVSPRKLRPEIGRDLETICLKALEKDRMRRYQTAAELAEDLDRWLRGEAIAATRAGVAKRIFARVRRQPVVWTLAASLLVVSTTLAVMHLRPRAESKPVPVAPTRELSVLISQAEKLLRQSRPDEAMIELEKALRINPASPDALYLRGFAFEHQGKTDEAVADFTRASQIDPKLPDPLYRLFWALAKLDVMHLDAHMGYSPPERDRQICASYEALQRLTLKPDQVECAAAMWEFRKCFSATIWGDVTLDRATPDLDALSALKRQILRHLDHALALNELNVEAYDFRALILYVWAIMGVDDPQADLAAGLASIDRALDIEPRNRYLLYEKAVILGRLGRRGEADKVAGKMIEIGATAWDAHLFHGVILSTIGDGPGALKAFERAESLGGDAGAIRMTRVMHFMEWFEGTPGTKPKNPAGLVLAAAEIQKLLERDPTHVPALIFSYFFKANAGNMAGAKADLDRAASIAPGNPVILKIRQSMKRR